MEDKLQEHLNNEFKQAIVKLENHAQIANEEVGQVKADIAVMRNDISWVKANEEEEKIRFDKFDAKLWAILSAVAFAILVPILLKVYGK